MSSFTSSAQEIIATPATPRRGIIGLYAELTKARLSALVLLTTAVGFVMGKPDSVEWPRLGWTVLGTALAAGCASALNQILEIRLDKRMHRTRRRPLPSGSMSVAHSFFAAMSMGVGGLSILAMQVNLSSAWLALATILIYVLIYTPLKVRSSLNTLVGAVCGAIPPMIGWTAATGSLDRGAWILGIILFVWQIPHFLALAWLYREDYARGGFAMLPVIDRHGHMTCRIILLTSLLLVPVGATVTLLNVAGYFYAIGSALLGLWIAGLSVRLHSSRSDAHARGVFLASITYLPILMCLMVLDRGPVRGGHIRQVPVASTSNSEAIEVIHTAALSTP